MPRGPAWPATRRAVASVPLTLAKWRENLPAPAVMRQSDAPAGGTIRAGALCVPHHRKLRGIDDHRRFPRPARSGGGRGPMRFEMSAKSDPRVAPAGSEYFYRRALSLSDL